MCERNWFLSLPQEAHIHLRTISHYNFYRSSYFHCFLHKTLENNTYPHLSRLLHWTLEWAFPCKTVARNNKSTFYLVESRKEKVNYPDSHLDSPLSNFTAGRGASLLVGSQPTTAAEQIEIVDSSDCCKGVFLTLGFVYEVSRFLRFNSDQTTRHSYAVFGPCPSNYLCRV